MANEEHLWLLANGVGAWNQWKRDCSDVLKLVSRSLQLDGLYVPPALRLDLSGADLSGANLSGVDFTLVNLRDANFSGTDLSGALLRETELTGASLHRANLRNANLTGADLSFADLNHASLAGANLSFADLRRADLFDTGLERVIFNSTNLDGAAVHGARLNLTVFVGCDLQNVMGLDSVQHWGPSAISVDSIYASRGQIPQPFLVDCGVPEDFVVQMRSFANAAEGIQFHSCFISYSHKDEEFAKRLHKRMRAANLRVWFAPEDMPGGKKLHEEIETQIHIHDKLLIVLSEESMQSEWVATEIHHARQREKKEERQILFPIRLCSFEEIRGWTCFDADTGKDMAREIREYLIPDFSNWKDYDQFEANFAKLLRDLRSSEKE